MQVLHHWQFSLYGEPFVSAEQCHQPSQAFCQRRPPERSTWKYPSIKPLGGPKLFKTRQFEKRRKIITTPMAAAQLDKDIEQPAAAAQQDEQQSGYQVNSSCSSPRFFPVALQHLCLPRAHVGPLRSNSFHFILPTFRAAVPAQLRAWVKALMLCGSRVSFAKLR